MIALLLMSIGSWYVIITKLIEQTVLLGHTRQANRRFWTAASIREGADLLAGAAPFAPWSRTGSTPAIIMRGR